MTPKEKAIELVDKYISFNKNKIAFVYTKESSKQCALIAVDELIADEHLEAGDSPYWIEVKKEIEAL